MKQQNHPEDNRRGESLTDLSVTNEQAEEAKGGVASLTRIKTYHCPSDPAPTY